MSASGALLPIESEMLTALRGGETARRFAERHHYSPGWAKWKMRVIRDKLGVTTTAEAVAMSEVTRADFDALQRSFADAISRLEKAITPEERASAKKDVGDAGADLDFELRLRGLSRKDLDLFAEQKRKAEIDGAVAAALEARDAEEKARLEAEAKAKKNGEGDEEEKEKKGLLDGLGGKTWGGRS